MARAPAVQKQKATALATTAFSEELDALKARLAAPTGDKIKIENKQFKLPGGAIADELDVVILDFVYYNAYYESAYTKGVVESPVCFSLSPDPKNASPMPSSPDAQDSSCDSCAQNQFGSKGKGKACQNRLRIAVLPGDVDTTDADTPIAILDIPPTSIKGFQGYVSNVARVMQRPPYGVRTHVSCDENETYAKVVFGAEKPIPFDMDNEDEVAFVNMLRARREEARERLMVAPEAAPANDAPKKTALKAPARRRA